MVKRNSSVIFEYKGNIQEPDYKNTCIWIIIPLNDTMSRSEGPNRQYLTIIDILRLDPKEFLGQISCK